MVAMLNFDMVGRLRDDKLVIYGVETAREWRGTIDSLNTAARFALTLEGDGYGPSDHTSFTLVKKPVLHFFTGTHVDYHRTTDDFDTINLDGILRVATLATDIVRVTGDRARAPDLRRVGAPRRGRGFLAHLGLRRLPGQRARHDRQSGRRGALGRAGRESGRERAASRRVTSSSGSEPTWCPICRR